MTPIPYKPGMKITAPCMILDMPNDVYHAHPDSVSKSNLDLIDQSPAHFFYRRPREQTRFMEIGTAIHAALLEPDRFKSEYVLLRDVKDRRASEYKEAAKVHGGGRVLTGSEADDVVGMQESVYAQPHAARWLKQPGLREVSVFARDPETGVMVRCRYDILTGNDIVDVKKTQDARPDAFSRSIMAYRYHVQAAFYMDVYEWATGKIADSFRFLAVEQSMPHAAMCYRIDDTALNEGRRLHRENLNRYAECLLTGDWPSYAATEDDVIGLPDWRIRQIENELDEAGITTEE